jgi:phosphoserine phosphatase
MPPRQQAIARLSFRTLSSNDMETSGAAGLHLTKQQFLDHVLGLGLRVAAFDCDGTLWAGDAGETFFQWEMKEGIVSAEVAQAMRTRYAEYKAGKVSEDDMCGEMVTMHRGISEAVMMRAASDFMGHSFPGHIFPEIQELVQRLHEQGCEIWAVSSSNEWVIRAGMKQFGIPEERILAAKVEVVDGIVTDRLVRVPSGPGKPQALREVAGKRMDAAFGNSRWDEDMLAAAVHGFAVNPNPDLEAAARERGWTVYFPEGTS